MFTTPRAGPATRAPPFSGSSRTPYARTIPRHGGNTPTPGRTPGTGAVMLAQKKHFQATVGAPVPAAANATHSQGGRVDAGRCVAWLVSDSSILLWQYGRQSNAVELSLDEAGSGRLATTVGTEAFAAISSSGQMWFWPRPFSAPQETVPVQLGGEGGLANPTYLCPTTAGELMCGTASGAVFRIALSIDQAGRYNAEIHMLERPDKGGSGFRGMISNYLGWGKGPGGHGGMDVVSVATDSGDNVVILTGQTLELWRVSTGMQRHAFVASYGMYELVSAELGGEAKSLVLSDVVKCSEDAALVCVLSSRTASPTHNSAIDIRVYQVTLGASCSHRLVWSRSLADVEGQPVSMAPGGAGLGLVGGFKASGFFVFIPGAVFMVTEDGGGDADEVWLAGEGILGTSAGYTADHAAMVSSRYGVIVLSVFKDSRSFRMTTPAQPSTPIFNNVGRDTPVKEHAAAPVVIDEGLLGTIKGAYQAFQNTDNDLAQTLLADAEKSASGDAALFGDAIVDLSQKIIDAVGSAQDWLAGAGRGDGGHSAGTTAVLLKLRLEEKEKAHDAFLHFLSSFNALNGSRLIDSLSPRSRTRLFEHSEKVASSGALRKVLHSPGHSDPNAVVHRAFGRVLLGDNQVSNDNLRDLENRLQQTGDTFQNSFFSQVSRVQTLIPAFFRELEAPLRAARERAGAEHGTHASSTDLLRFANKVALAIVGGALAHRTAMAAPADGDIEKWTGARDLREVILKTIDENGMEMERVGSSAHDLLGDVRGLVDIVMTEYTGQRDNQQYRDACRRALRPFKIIGKMRECASLAARHRDFISLVEICESDGYQTDLSAADRSRMLQSYIDQFANDGFLMVLFDWLRGHSREERLLELCGDHPNIAEEFLRPYPELRWKHHLREGAGADSVALVAREALELSEVENKDLWRKQSLSSIAMLSHYAAGGRPTDAYIAHVQDYQVHMRMQLKYGIGEGYVARVEDVITQLTAQGHFLEACEMYIRGNVAKTEETIQNILIGIVLGGCILKDVDIWRELVSSSHTASADFQAEQLKKTQLYHLLHSVHQQGPLDIIAKDGQIVRTEQDLVEQLARTAPGLITRGGFQNNDNILHGLLISTRELSME